ncbi:MULTISPECIES: hypothetical protein [Pseudoalteromonas]|uniref:Tat pathway signal sequence domain protein n=1 Tax=Pseudoalteromonas amylolytica TaxID=1859457 RepID=A0A1S1MSG3_9GAMM|nr:MULTISPECIES: hypothetical protein [Pseudoalteromonas]MCF6437719.1 hypothetical protein [Pseudoalteromonas sp. MMG022]OHU84986.1 hypothetical protein BFC16_20060 [Pseudoalteromonas sp. JW3]OHU90063.1 hypothetical protein BET10_14915 [Pseudoalteromonas amylolytica]
MTTHIFSRRSLLSLASAVLTLPVLASPGDWINTSGDFATLNPNASEVRFAVHYPQLRDGNCGIGIALNGFNSREHYYRELLEHIDVRSIYLTDSGLYELSPSSVTDKGILYSFDYTAQYYMTYVTINTKDGRTFGEVFDGMSSWNSIYALTSAVTCQQLEEVNLAAHSAPL